MTRRTGMLRSFSIEEPLINLTPLIDVVFVILIMFILVAPLVELDRVDLAEAASNSMETSVSVQAQSPIAIYVHKDNRITFNGQSVTLQQLPALFKQSKAKHPNARPQLFHDRRAQFGTYQNVKNAAEGAGFRQLDVVLKND